MKQKTREIYSHGRVYCSTLHLARDRAASHRSDLLLQLHLHTRWCRERNLSALGTATTDFKLGGPARRAADGSHLGSRQPAMLDLASGSVQAKRRTGRDERLLKRDGKERRRLVSQLTNVNGPTNGTKSSS